MYLKEKPTEISLCLHLVVQATYPIITHFILLLLGLWLLFSLIDKVWWDEDIPKNKNLQVIFE
jgi:hypothetical protein